MKQKTFTPKVADQGVDSAVTRIGQACAKNGLSGKLFLNRIEFTLCRKNLHSIAVPFAAEVFLAELLDHTRGRISYYCGVLVDLVEHHEVYTLISRPSECDDIRSGYFWKMLKVPFHRHDIEAKFSGSKQKVKYVVVEFDPE